MFFGRRGSGNVTIERITFIDTLKAILAFVLLYAIAGGLQLAIFGVVAMLLGALAGPVFLALALALEFRPRFLIDTRPFRIGGYLQRVWGMQEKPDHVKVAQFLLGIIGVLAIGLLLLGYWPNLWPMRVASFALESCWPWSMDWHAVGQRELVLRVGLLLSVPFVGWSSGLILQWCAKMEAIRPSFRETSHAPVDPSSVRGPMGEEYRRVMPARDDDDDDMVIMPDYE